MDKYHNVYIPSLIRIGRIIFIISLLLFFCPFLISWFVYGVTPQWSQIGKASLAWLVINAPWWIIEPISFFPVLGIPGLFISFLSGNGTNMRMPCALAAQKATDTHPGTIQGGIISAIGISASVFVNLAILAAGVFVGQQFLSLLPPSATAAMDFLLPALFGCVIAQYSEGNTSTGIIALVLGVGSLMMKNHGMFNWFPIDPSIPAMLLPIFGTMAIAYFTSKNKKDDADVQEAHE